MTVLEEKIQNDERACTLPSAHFQLTGIPLTLGSTHTVLYAEVCTDTV